LKFLKKHAGQAGQNWCAASDDWTRDYPQAAADGMIDLFAII